MSDVVVDTDDASAILKGQLPDTLAHRLAGQRLAITFVTVGELTQWTYLHRWGTQQRAGLPLATFNIKDYADFAEHEGLELVY